MDNTACLSFIQTVDLIELIIFKTFYSRYKLRKSKFVSRTALKVRSIKNETKKLSLDLSAYVTGSGMGILYLRFNANI